MMAFALLCLLAVPFQLLLITFYKGRYAYILPHLWHKGVCAIFRIRVQKTGKIYTNSQVLYMSNHLSYLDIPAIASVLCFGSFVAKKDVASWPVFGFLSTLQQTAFISRSRGDAKKEASALDTMLENGKNLIIFPEGTSTDGQSVLDFKSSLFAIALREDLADIMIQPVTVKLLSVNGHPPETQEDRDLYAWHRDMDGSIELHHHLWSFAKSSGAALSITFHETIPAKNFPDRKTLAKACHEAVSNGLQFSKAA
ncbi:MAG: lysophospholipid acyltransferase family protein [Alphaproteobacteria bacterium]